MPKANKLATAHAFQAGPNEPQPTSTTITSAASHLRSKCRKNNPQTRPSYIWHDDPSPWLRRNTCDHPNQRTKRPSRPESPRHATQTAGQRLNRQAVENLQSRPQKQNTRRTHNSINRCFRPHVRCKLTEPLGRRMFSRPCREARHSGLDRVRCSGRRTGRTLQRPGTAAHRFSEKIGALGIFGKRGAEWRSWPSLGRRHRCCAGGQNRPLRLRAPGRSGARDGAGG